ncbi:hypothetical protein BJ322DRAFT_1058741 [Thelephora terrestris]|uniref:Uncharacterized protein n=1 Tax=Thelephora terrestris TaxID=56493 RepID=A0A9P6HFY8_9AGAM|nr:hypothetical protein BJ322DRAFT_1058741 [Thelephora terrestris]
MPPRDPALDIQPNFESEEWSIPRVALIAQGNSEEQAIAALRKSWEDFHQRNLEAWDEYLQQQQGNQDNEGEDPPNPIIPPVTAPSTMEERPSWADRPTPSFLDIQPAHQVMKRLEKREYVELWHFTAQGCRDAAQRDLEEPDQSIRVIPSNKGMIVKAGSTGSISSKAIRDEDLTYDQWSEGKTRLLKCMEGNGWTAEETRELAKFFLNLDFDPMRSEINGLQAVMRYQEKVRRDWVKSLKNGTGYAIGTINRNLLNDYHRQVQSEIQARNNARQDEILSRQEEMLDRMHSRPTTRTRESRLRRYRSSRSRSPVRHPNRQHHRSRSPEVARRQNFRTSAPATPRSNRLPACPICLGRHKHHPASCQATKMWNGSNARCSRAANGRILNNQGGVLCTDWQRPNRCTNFVAKHLHECSGCGSSEHGADSCHNAQP